MAEFKKQYNPNRGGDWNYGGKNWKLSRSKIELFVECPRCFYLDNKLGTARPRGPAFTLNVAVDERFKYEFDVYRKDGQTHPLMKEFGIPAIPYAHKKLDEWRDNFAGITHVHKETGLTISGAVDDIWQMDNGELAVVDYKATAKAERVDDLSKSGWEASYRRQIGVYQWLLRQNDFSVSTTGYFVYANARENTPPGFNNVLQFETTVIPCAGETDWIDETILEIKKVLDSDKLPPIGANCEFCPYREACGKKLQTIHKANLK